MIMTQSREIVSSNRDVSRIIGSWRKGGRPSTRDVLSERPELRDCASVVVQLAHEEYCLRREAGERVAASTFCELFPTVQGKLRQLLEVEDALLDFPLDQEEEETVWPELDEQFLDFELLSILGEGAAARVYLARQTNLGNRFVALKVSHFGGSEAEILGKLQHPHVVPIHSVHFDEQRELTAVCMPYLGAATLRDIGKRACGEGWPARSAAVILEAAGKGELLGEAIKGERPADPRLKSGRYVDGIVHMMAELADGLSYTHDHQVMHRDLKPSNVLVTPQGRPMLLDFNLSWDADLEVSRMGGTLPYMPSEQIYATFFARKGHLANDPRTDIFSLGVILYELLTGEIPFPTPASPSLDSLHQLLGAHAEGVSVRRIQERNPDISDSLARLIQSCLAQDPGKRPPTAANLAAQLRDRLPLVPGIQNGPETQAHRRGGAWSPWLAAGILGAALASISFVAARLNVPSPALSLSSEHVEAPAKTRAELVQQAFELVQNGDFQRALQRLEEAEELATGPSLLPHQAYCCFLLGDIGRSITLLNQAIERSPSDPDLRNNFGYCHLRGGTEIYTAKQLFEEVLDSHPYHPQALLNRAMCNLSLRKEGHAESDWGVEFADRAVAAFSEPNATVYLAAARLHALAAKDRRKSRPYVEKYLMAASDLEIDPSLVRNMPEFRPIRNEVWFAEAFGPQTETRRQEPNGQEWHAHFAPPKLWR